MAIDPTDIAIALGGSGAVGAGVWGLVKLTVLRVIAKEDEANKKRDQRLQALEGAAVNIDKFASERMTRIEGSLQSVSKDLGRLESDISRTLGRVDGLQSDWRTKFEKLETELRARDEKLTEMIHGAKAENAKGIAELRVFLEEYRHTVHDRLNQITTLIIAQNEDLKSKGGT